LLAGYVVQRGAGSTAFLETDVAAISRCGHGLRGHVSVNGSRYEIEPLQLASATSGRGAAEAMQSDSIGEIQEVGPRYAEVRHQQFDSYNSRRC